jgi:lipopolysaccharide export system protein LptA
VCNSFLAAQTKTSTSDDSMRVIQIIQGKSLREKTIDSGAVIETVAGNVILKQGTTTFDCDSVVLYGSTNIMEAFGNIHINQDDTINTYSQYLRYIGNDHMAFLKNNVKLTDGKGTLYTQALQYDLKSGIGNYTNGGKVINGKTVLTSDNGTYYADTKDVYFKNNVHLVDPKYDIITDSLLYNTQTQVATFITNTLIKSKSGGDVYTSQGTYDLQNGKAFFGKRSIIKDSTRMYVADNIATDEKSGMAQLEGNAIIKDTANGYTILGNQIYLDKKKNTFLATRKPVVIFSDGSDSTFIAADTIFSGVGRPYVPPTDSSAKRDSVITAIIKKDALQKESTIQAESFINFDTSKNDSSVSLIMKNDSLANADVIEKDSSSSAITKKDSLSNPVSSKKDSLLSIIEQKDSIQKNSIIKNDSLFNSNTLKKDSILYSIAGKDSVQKNVTLKKDSLGNTIDTLKKTTVITSSDTTLRYFQAFHNVRIYNDSLQAVCDSLFYTSEDSTFRLFHQPLVFANQSQISGDTIYLYTKYRKPKRLYVFNNGMIINELNVQMYNQISGRTINGYFKNGQLDYMRSKGSPAESVYYPQNDDSAYIGMNRAKGDVIDIYFINKEVNKVKFVNDVDGTLYPMRQIPADQKTLKGFKWLDSRRPKSKLELFE